MTAEPSEDIVIAGISGRFPESDNVEEFKQQLLDGVDLVTDDETRWPSGMYNLPTRTGKMRNLSRFDAFFFGVHSKQAESMDPQLRFLLEVTYEAIVDAGVNPNDIRGSRTGVYIGASNAETMEFWEKDPDKMTGYSLSGGSVSSFANRLAYTFDFHGPSYTVDSACSSSLVALQQAFMAIKAGECDAAIVGGVNSILKPERSLAFHRLNMLNTEGKCQSLDSSANGYVRSEAAVVIYLQKAKVAKRIYATILGTKVNTDGYKPEGYTFPSADMQNKLLHETYTGFMIDPSEVSYMEVHATGTKAGDPQEANAIADFFCQNRREPLQIGSVKSNMGHAEAASGLCSLAKIVISMETGVIPANLHFKSPNENIPALMDGRLKVVTTNQVWHGGLVGINSFGMGGTNVHVVLKPNSKEKIKVIEDCLPRVVPISGRTREAVNTLLNSVEKNRNDKEFLSLVSQIHENVIKDHLFRGYCVLNDASYRDIEKVSAERRPIWFIYSGMGSQCAVGKELMQIEVFRNSIKKSSLTLQPYGVNLEDIILNGEDSTFENITNSLLTITSVQIALTDLLKSLGVEPDGIIGHSVGEIGCAYADETFTAAQTICCAYQRSQCIEKTNLVEGSMAAIGLPWEEVEKKCPPDVFIACHNSKDNTTISGLQNAVDKFMNELTSKDVFVRKVKGCNVAYHSKYVADVGPKLRKALGVIIPKPKPRTTRWISSSVPESQWMTTIAQYSSAEYHVNNFLSPVLFEEALKHIPDNAIVIEVAATGLLHAILKRSLGPDVTNVSLLKKECANSVQFLFTALGKLYNAGAQPKFALLYPTVHFPVGRGTPMIAPSIKWDHSEEWTVANFVQKGSKSSEMIVEVNVSAEEDRYLLDHCIDDRVLFPATGYLVLIWKAFSKLRNKYYKQQPVIIENIHIHRATVIPKEGSIKFFINILEGISAFEICEGGCSVVTGRIYCPGNVYKDLSNSLSRKIQTEEDLPFLSNQDIYKELRLRGYDYGDNFRGIMETDNRCTNGKLKWSNNWVTYLDTMLQFWVLNKSRNLYLPTRIETVVINPKEHLQTIMKCGGSLSVSVDQHIGVVKSGGIEIIGLKASLAQRRMLKHTSPKLEKYQFVPYKNLVPLSDITALTVLLQVIAENTFKSSIRIAEITDGCPDGVMITTTIKNILDSEPMCLSVETEVLSYEEIEKSFDYDLVVVVDALRQNRNNWIETIVKSLPKNGFLLLQEANEAFDICKISPIGVVVGTQLTDNRIYALLRIPKEVESDAIVIKITEKDFEWVKLIKKELTRTEFHHDKIYLYVQNEDFTGLMGMMNCLKREPGGEKVRAVYIEDVDAAPFSVVQYLEQLKKDLLHNVLKNNVWGSYRHVLLEDEKVLVEHAYINTTVRGDLSSFQWIQSPLKNFRKDDLSTELCQIYYSALNFRDIMLATGNLPPNTLPEILARQDCILGLEFSGLDTKAKRVMGIVPARSLATSILADPGFLWSVPDHWTLEEASTIPIVYATGYYALIVKGCLKQRETVLIHAGAGGVGIASITIAFHMGCKVFTTVGSQEKRAYLKTTFPELTDNCIGNSRDTSFERLVLAQTHGRGVDLVLNSLAGDQLQASVRCLAEGGRFLEIGKADLGKNTSLGMSVLLKNTSFYGVHLDTFFYSNSSDKKKLWRLVNEGIVNGTVKPLPHIIFDAAQIEEAFRFMASGKHIGKVVIKIRDETSKPLTVMAIPRTYMNPDKSYIIVGGLGGFGLELTNWLIERGVTKLVLTSTRGVKTSYQSLCVRRWSESGITIVIFTSDASTSKGARKLLGDANLLGFVGGIFNLALVLRDALMENQSEVNFAAVCKPKIDVTKHLDVASRVMCPHLDYFVTFSSVACGRGNAGQTNYGFANSAMERICEARRDVGLPGLAIQWGVVGDVGHIAETKGVNRFHFGKMVPQSMMSCLATMDIFLPQSNPIVSSMVLMEKRAENVEAKKVGLAGTIANILGVKDFSTVQQSISFAEQGIDSLMIAETKQMFERKCNLVLSTEEIRALNFERVHELESPFTQSTEASSENAQFEFVASISDELIPSECLVRMHSKATVITKKPLFLIHPIQGIVNMLQPLVKNIVVPVFGLQCTKTTPISTVEDMAAHYTEKVQMVQAKGPYILGGYSFGAAVAFEMGLQLEKHGEKVSLLLIEGSPTYIAKICENNKSSKNKEESLVYVASEIKKYKEQDIVPEMLTLKIGEERLKRIMGVFFDPVYNTASEAADAVVGLYDKIEIGLKYKPSSKLKGSVTLIKATQNLTDSSTDYGLSEICDGEVKTRLIDGDHTSILTGVSAAKIADIFHEEVLGI